MSEREFIVLPNMEQRPYSSAVRAGDFIFFSGTVGVVDPQGEPVEGIEAQTRRCLQNLKRTLEAAGASFPDVVKVQVFLSRAEDWDKMNEVYKEYFPKDRPARTTLIHQPVKPKTLIEMECIAYKPGPKP